MQALGSMYSESQIFLFMEGCKDAANMPCSPQFIFSTLIRHCLIYRIES